MLTIAVFTVSFKVFIKSFMLTMTSGVFAFCYITPDRPLAMLTFTKPYLSYIKLSSRPKAISVFLFLGRETVLYNQCVFSSSLTNPPTPPPSRHFLHRVYDCINTEHFQWPRPQLLIRALPRRRQVMASERQPFRHSWPRRIASTGSYPESSLVRRRRTLDRKPVAVFLLVASNPELVWVSSTQTPNTHL
jgi:hypothetical protein